MATREMKIHTFDVGPGHPVLVVAEIGSNHGGSFDAALALIDAAADAGANAAKFQLWLSADEMYDKAQFPTEWETTQKYRLPVEWLPTLRDRAHERGMAFGLSSFGFASLDEADKLVDFHKVASIEHTWEPFRTRVLDKARPTLISIGLHDCESASLLGYSISMICSVAYPCSINEVDLRRHPVGKWGFSDHTTHPTIAPCAAVALGACVVEKHIRLHPFSRYFVAGSEKPPDWDHSMKPTNFRFMVADIRLTEKALGSSEKRIRPSEEPYLRFRRGPRGLRGA